MRERVRGLGGRLNVESRREAGPGGSSGTRIEVDLPLKESNVMSQKIRVLICDDHSLLREGLRAILREQPSFEVVGDARNGIEAVEATRRLRPDVVLMDIDMPELSGLEATRRIHEARLPGKVLILSLYDDEDLIAGCLDAGASGYVLKDTPSAQLLYAIEAVHRGERYMSPRALSMVVEHGRKGGKETGTRYDLLTDREREVLKLLADGFSSKDLAARLDLSVKTVDAHKYNLMRKLDIHNRAGLVKYAIRKKLVQVPMLEETPEKGNASA
jgi:DNA-binding NarL/FixJ family response regulator